MEIRDVIHGSVIVEPGELAVIDSRYFQRLREIKQLGFAEFSFPAATHNRYAHSLGAMGTASRAFETIFGKRYPERLGRFRAVLRLAALLHDIGHGPLSHTTEFSMPPLADLALPNAVKRSGPRKANHEDYTLKFILDSGLTPVLEKVGALHGFSPLHIASLIHPSIEIKDRFFFEEMPGEKDASPVHFQPLLRQLISSEIDADRMDYLRRDSFHTGVSYGQFDFDWLIGNLTYHVKNGKCFLSLKHRALYAFEDFLISRFHMFLMVYFHHKSVVFDSLLERYFQSQDADYVLPSDIEKYCQCTDAHLISHLTRSQNPWAKRIVARDPYRMLVELHSGIPAGKTAAAEQQRLFAQIQKDLKSRKIDFLAVTSTGELSKYFRKPGDPIYVRYDNHYSAPSFIPLERCTDLFERYQEKRFISRLYVSPEDFSQCRNEGRGTPFKYEPN